MGLFGLNNLLAGPSSKAQASRTINSEQGRTLLKLQVQPIAAAHMDASASPLCCIASLCIVPVALTY